MPAWLLSTPGVNAIAQTSNLFARDPKAPRPARPQVVQAMIAALGNEAAHPTQRSPAVRAALASGLRYLTDQDFGENAAKWQTWFEAHQGDFAHQP